MTYICNFQFDRNDVATYHEWPHDGIERYGQVQRAPVFEKQALRNRQNPKISHVCKVVMGWDDDLLCNMDRYCFMRPTKDVQCGDEVKDFPQFKTASNLHLDIDPWSFSDPECKETYEDSLAALTYGRKLNQFIFENNQTHLSLYDNDGTQLQAGINLAENLDDDGGFQLVPGFRNHFADWVAEARDGSADAKYMKGSKRNNSLQFDKKHPLHRHSLRIAMRAGSLVLWDQRTPHGSVPNNSSRPRFAQFLKMFPSTPMDETRRKNRSATISQIIRRLGFEGEVTELGRRVFGI